MTSAPTEAYPLAWPHGRKRTTFRESAKFRSTFAITRDDIVREVRLLGGTGLILSTNVPLRRDGLPYAGMAQPHDPGVAVYFIYKKRQMCFACDRWRKVEDNMRAIALTIESLRGIARWGTGDMMEAAFTGFTALPPPTQDNVKRDWRVVLGLSNGATREDARNSYRRLAMENHPDRGGRPEAMAEINMAWEEAQRALP